MGSDHNKSKSQLIAELEELRLKIAALSEPKIRIVAEPLDKSDVYYRTLFESTGTALIIIGNDSIIQKCNSQFEVLSGFSRDDVEGKMKWSEFVDPVDLERMHRYNIKRLAGLIDNLREYDFLFLGQDKIRKHVHMVITMISGTKDRICSLSDMSALLKAQEALRRSEERLSLVVRGTNDGYWDWNLENNTVYFSPRYKQILGFSDEDFPNSLESWRKSVYPEDVKPAWVALRKIIDGEMDHVEHEFRMHHKDGSVRWTHSKGTGLRNDKGVVYRLAGMQTDITERKQMEVQLAESEERYRLLTEHATSAIAVHEIVLDADNRPIDFVFLSVNPAFEPQTGMKPSDVIGRRASETIPGIEKTPLIEVFGQVVLSGQSVSFEHYFEPLKRNYLVSAYKVGENRFAAVFTDITELKRAESEKTAIIAKLEKTLAEVNTLRGLIPICSQCKKIRDDKGYWNNLESYIEKHSGASFSHGMCEECSEKLYGKEGWYIRMKEKKGNE